MADNYGLELSGLPPELTADMRGLTRDQAIQEALLKQSMTPGGGVIDAGRFKVAHSPIEGVAKVVQAFMAKQGLAEGDAKAADIGKRYQAGVTSAFDNFQKTATGTPGYTAPPRFANDDEGNPESPVQVAAAKGDPRKAVMEAMMNPYLKNNPNLGAMSKMVTPDWEVVEQYGPDGQKQKFLIDKNNPQGGGTPFGGPAKFDPKIQDISVPTPAGKTGPFHQKHISVDNGVTWKPVPGSVPVEIHAKQVAPTVVVGGDDAKHQPISVVKRGPDGKDDPKLGTELISRAQAIKEKRTEARTDAATQGNVAAARANSSPQAQRELIQTDEEIQAGSQVLTSLAKARAINEKAMGFIGAGLVSKAGTLLPEELRPEAVDHTNDLENVITSTTLPQLKAVFGGNPTEGERKILLDVAGSVNANPKVRGDIFKRSEDAVNARLKLATDKAASIRNNTYFKEDGGVAPTLPGGKAPGVPSGLPPGAKLIGKTPDGKLDVYEAPDGKKYTQ